MCIRDRYRDISNKQVLGLHSPKWTNELIFGRYFDLMDKYKARGYRWMGELPFKLYGMFKNNPNELNFFAMMGTITNLLCNKEIPLEKDDSIKNEHYQNLCSLLQQEKPKTFIEKLLPPTTATLSMTTKCSAKCSFCLRQSKTIEQAPDMTVEKIEEILEVFPSIASFALCGFGNPTDCDNFDDIVKFLHKKKLGMGIIVNGIGLKKKIYLLKKHKPNYISISLNAPTQELHEEITKTTNQFDKILEAIQKCVEARITTYLTYVCTTENLVHVPAFLKLAKGLKVSGVHLFNVLPHHLVTNQNKEEFLKLVLTDKNSDDIKKLKQLPEASIVKEFPILINPNDQKRYCRFAWQKLSINGFGNISICNSIFPPEAKNGNIRDANVWTNDYCKNFRDNFIGKLPLPCELCFRNYKRK